MAVELIKVVPDTDQGFEKMRNKIIVAVAIGIASISCFCSYASKDTANGVMATETECNASSEGTHCSGSVGCSCSGFSPITNGKEWQKSYCRKCGHGRQCHR